MWSVGSAVPGRGGCRWFSFQSCVLRCVLLLRCVWMTCRALRALKRRFDRHLNRPRCKVMIFLVLGITFASRVLPLHFPSILAVLGFFRSVSFSRGAEVPPFGRLTRPRTLIFNVHGTQGRKKIVKTAKTEHWYTGRRCVYPIMSSLQTGCVAELSG